MHSSGFGTVPKWVELGNCSCFVMAGVNMETGPIDRWGRVI